MTWSRRCIMSSDRSARRPARGGCRGYPGAGRESLEQAAIEAAWGAQSSALDHHVLPQPGVAQSSAEPLVRAATSWSTRRPQPVLARQIVGRRLIVHVAERVASAKPGRHGMGRHRFPINGGISPLCSSATDRHDRRLKTVSGSRTAPSREWSRSNAMG